jgi:hypothetical protein
MLYFITGITAGYHGNHKKALLVITMRIGLVIGDY